VCGTFWCGIVGNEFGLCVGQFGVVWWDVCVLFVGQFGTVLGN